MPPLLFPLPTTSILTFSAILVDPSSSHTTALADATAARTKLFLALKAEGSALAVVDAVQGYLPTLRGIIECLDSDELLLKGDPTFPWRSPLTHYTSTAPLLPLPSIHSEYLFVVLTYILALSNYAHSILASLPTFDQGSRSSITTEDEKKTTAGLARAVDLLCQAAGIAQWAAENVMPLVEPVRVAAGGRAGKNKWPVEAGSEAFRGLAEDVRTLLADAHVTAIRKLLLPVLSHTLFAPPGPPLPTNHPSASLLAKLYLHISTLYTSARATFKLPSRQLLKSSDKAAEPDNVEGEVIAPFKRYLRKESQLAEALAHKWLGVDAGENSKGSRIGEAVAWTRDAQTRLSEMEDGAVREKMKALGLGKGNERKKEERKARKGRVERELEDVQAWVRVYTRMNDTVSFQPIPAVASLNVPSGRPIFTAKAFVPPPPKLGTTRTSDPSDDSYAGQGNYY
ncbi:hypothetical protein BCR39DRAFT_461419 [Naematelia encephala]|uniref:pH-response regulator protein palC n=1 Tax=Naematelia encephala TaxID=71784 RepID=A0A1Y2BLF1_9TREE|nr:hypothetical protein BCR39DRAFT_461419 [Naematelia encephala]